MENTTIPVGEGSVGEGEVAPVTLLLGELDGLVERMWGVADRLDDADNAAALAAPVKGMDFLTRGGRARRSGVIGSRLTHLSDRVWVRAAAELLASRGHRHDASTTPARWIEHHCGLTRVDAQRVVRVSRLLRDLPGLSAGFAAGSVRMGHLDAIARIIPSRLRGDERAAMVAALAECTGELAAAAENTPVRRFERFCAGVRDRLDPDGSFDGGGDPSRVFLTAGFAGRWNLTGDLSADDGAQLATYLEQRTRTTLHARAADDGRTGAEGPEGNEVPEGPEVVMSEVRAEALIGLCRDGAGARQPGRVALNLHIDLADLRCLDPAPLRASTGAGTDITEATLWELLADADVRPIYCEGATPLSYGRTRRLTPEILRTVLAHRQPRCCVPGCDAPPPWHQHHHLVRWADGGTTDPANNAGVCGPHHRGHHDGSWTLHPRSGSSDPWDTTVTVSRPDGTNVPIEPRWATHNHTRSPYRQRVLERLRRLTPRPPPRE